VDQWRPDSGARRPWPRPFSTNKALFTESDCAGALKQLCSEQVRQDSYHMRPKIKQEMMENELARKGSEQKRLYRKQKRQDSKQ